MRLNYYIIAVVFLIEIGVILSNFCYKIEWDNTRVVSSITRKHSTWLKVFARDKHSSLLVKRVGDRAKSFIRMTLGGGHSLLPDSHPQLTHHHQDLEI